MNTRKDEQAKNTLRHHHPLVVALKQYHLTKSPNDKPSMESATVSNAQELAEIGNKKQDFSNGMLSVNLSAFGQEISQEYLKTIQQTITSPLSPVVLGLDVSCALDEACLETLNSTFTHASFPPVLYLTHQRMGLTQDAMCDLMSALMQSPLAYLSMDMTKSYIGKEGMEAICEAIESNQLPDMLNFYFWETSFGGDQGLIRLASALQFSHEPKVIEFSFGDVFSNHQGVTQAGVKALALAMLSCTSVRQFNLSATYPMGEECYPYMEVIELCCRRNKLISQFPQHAAYIKHFCRQRGMYLPSKSDEAPSLKMLVGCFFAERNALTEEVSKQLPIEVVEFAKQLAEITKPLQALEMLKEKIFTENSLDLSPSAKGLSL